MALDTSRVIPLNRFAPYIDGSNDNLSPTASALLPRRGIISATSADNIADMEKGERRAHKFDDTQYNREKRKSGTSFSIATIAHRIPVTRSLPLLVFLDSFAVSLVVPLLFQYYKAAGVTQARHREYLSSLFSTAQIVGGLLLGVLTDAHIVTRHTVLMLSFAGSAVSYALIVYGGLQALIISRVLVGLVKQTMTITTTMMSKATNRETRAKSMGRLSASLTLAWIIGPLSGSLLWEYVDHNAPALLACSIFIFLVFLSSVIVPHDDNRYLHDTASDVSDTIVDMKKSKAGSFIANIKTCCQSRSLITAVAVQLTYTWIQGATNSAQLGSFFEDMYGLKAHHRGYISSYQELLKFITQAVLVGPIMAIVGGERRTVSLFAFATTSMLLLQATAPIWIFFAVVCPVTSLAYAMMSLSLQTLITHVAPQASIFSVLAALDVLQNVVSVSVPFYRTWLFAHLNKSVEGRTAMAGDPDPFSWLVSSSLHWFLAAIIMSTLLLLWHHDHDEAENNEGKRLTKSGRTE